MRVVFSKRAKTEREQAIRYLALRSPQAAANLIRRISRSTRLLGQNPGFGRAGQEEGTLEWVIPDSRYVLIYRVNQETKRVEVLRLHHTSRDR